MTGWKALRSAQKAWWVVLLALGVLVCGGLSASEMARPFGEPTPKYLQTTIGFFLRDTRPDAEGGSSIPRFMLSINSPLFSATSSGHARLFFGGSYADGEVLLGTNDVVFGVGGFITPFSVVDREYLKGDEQAGTEVDRTSYAGRVMIGSLQQDSKYLRNVEVLGFYQWGFEQFRRRSRTDPTFVMPLSTPVESWGFTIGFDDAWESKAETAQRQNPSLQAAKEHQGSYFQLMGLFTDRLKWHPWGLPSRPTSSNSMRTYPKFALAAGSDDTQLSGDQVDFSFTFRAGYGEDLDRFSAFRLGGGTDMDRDLNRAPLYGYHFEEFLADRYATAIVDFGVKFDGLIGTTQGTGQTNGNQNTATITRFHMYYQQAYLNEMNLGSDQLSKKAVFLRSAGTALTTSYLRGVYIRIDVAYGFDARRKNDSQRGGWETVFSAESSY